ncbi:hypothetical protein, partial [Burkholderia ubonensis]|uniref:hypothetical protein n=1 Tax=Burkholderia ubonensis TaxID=101571 RepID=UPI001E2A716A
MVTAPRALRRARPIENSPAVRRLVKTVEPVDTELHPKPIVLYTSLASATVGRNKPSSSNERAR